MKVFKVLWWKRYFDTGLGLTSYVKYLIAFLGLYSISAKISLKWTVVVGILYMIGCFFLGWIWIKYKLADQENEISNQLNPFQKEMRKKLKKKSLK